MSITAANLFFRDSSVSRLVNILNANYAQAHARFSNRSKILAMVGTLYKSIKNYTSIKNSQFSEAKMVT